MPAVIEAPPPENPAPENDKPQADPWNVVLMRDLALPPDSMAKLKEPKEEKTKPEEKPPEAVKPVEPPVPAVAPAASPATPPVAEAPKPEPIAIAREAPIGKQVEDAVSRALDSRLPKQPEAPKAPEPPKDADVDYVAGLGDDLRRRIELAEYAEQSDPANKGLRREVIDWLKARDKYIVDHQGEEGRTFDGNDEEFVRFNGLKQPKRFTPDQQKLIEVEKRTEERVMRKLKPEIDQVRAKADEGEATARSVAAKPRIEQAVKTVESESLAFDPGDNEALREVLDTVKTKGREAALDVDPVYAQIVSTHLDHARTVAAEFSALTNGVKSFDAQNPVHQFIWDFMETQGRNIAENGGDMRYKKTADGRTITFVPRSEFARLAREEPSKKGNHFTFSDDDVLQMIGIHSRQRIQDNAKIVQERLTKSGWSRVKKAPEAIAQAPENPKTPAPAKNGKHEPENDEDEDSPKVGGGSPAPAGGRGNLNNMDSLFGVGSVHMKDVIGSKG